MLVYGVNMMDYPSPLVIKRDLNPGLSFQVWEDNCRGRGPLREEECPELNMVWLDCNGEDDPDKENIGSVSYTPW